MSGAPSYTSEPGPGERRLALALPGAHASTTSFGTLIQRGSGMDVALYNQQDGARRASYGRSAAVTGEVSLSNTHGVTSVQITLEGKATSVSGMSKRLHVELLHDSATLWENGRAYPCPGVLPFSFIFPTGFAGSEPGPAHALPPSYDSAFSIHDMRVRCAYELIVLVARSRWVPNRSITIDIDYKPRTLPARAIMDMPFPFFETVKSAAEEWFQTSAALSSKEPSTWDPVHCNLFIPSIRAFSKDATVPFFLQLRGSISSMLALYGSGMQHDSGSPLRLTQKGEHANQVAPRISVTIKRQVVIHNENSAKVVRTYTIGTSSLSPVPPGYVPEGEDVDVYSVTDDYEGEIQFLPTLSTSSFDIGQLRITDFVVLSIEPQGKAASQFDPLTRSEGVRIVTG